MDTLVVETKGQFRRRQRREMARDQDWCCWWCGGMMIDTSDEIGLATTIEHLVPRGKGGCNSRSNLVVAHRRCNGKRGDALHTVEHPSMRGTKRWNEIRGYVNEFRYLFVTASSPEFRGELSMKSKLALAQRAGLLGPVRDDPRDTA